MAGPLGLPTGQGRARPSCPTLPFFNKGEGEDGDNNDDDDDEFYDDEDVKLGSGELFFKNKLFPILKKWKVGSNN